MAAKMEKVGKVDGFVEQILGLLHHNIKELLCIDEGEQETVRQTSCLGFGV